METMKINKLIPAIMADVGAIEKGRKNQAQGYSFRGIDDLYSAFQKLFVKHGVFYTSKVISHTREEKQSAKGGFLNYTIITMQFHFVASEDGSCVSVTTIGEAMDSGDKSANKAMSAALKYALIQLFCIPTEGDNDTENSSPEVAPKTMVTVVSVDKFKKEVVLEFTPKQANDFGSETQSMFTEEELRVDAENTNAGKLTLSQTPATSPHTHCGVPMKKSQFIDNSFGHKPWYCAKCKFKVAAE